MWIREDEEYDDELMDPDETPEPPYEHEPWPWEEVRR